MTLARAERRTQGFHDFISTAVKMVEAVGDWQEGRLNNSNMFHNISQHVFSAKKDVVER